MTTTHAPTRAEALSRLARFAPRAGRAYAAGRNHDRPGEGHPAVSGLSPYLRHRLITEEEVLKTVLGRHGPAAAEKFVSEVFWRTYWKGWLERRPSVWTDYRAGVRRALAGMEDEPSLAARVAAAEAGETGIACFDAWAHELRQTGYLHNHARMWTASIWIFTLRLPWEIGADWFLRHLLDGDPASNTLSWRWVAGLQTRGKHYVARAENIARYTDGRFDRRGELDEAPLPLDGPPHPPLGPVPSGDTPRPGLRTGVLLTEEDLSPGFLLAAPGGLADPVASYATLLSVADRSPRGVSAQVDGFSKGAIEDARDRWSERLGTRGPDAETVEEIADWARSVGLEQLVTAYAPVGPAAEALDRLNTRLAGSGTQLVRVMRVADRAAWAYATHGFFRFKSRIPDMIEDMTQSGD
ncbi:DNA photolyase [Roseibacterium sp. SDUM158016]|uniref:FAD-binding domain-containing protein n=1 Tax=Roseicyclus sediminis TaxID=2980997 RepID=UPI0021CEC4B3|nr:FAD-binding domain-containing protein [Roseibacterium sp. SDUM158016]MCU4652837.1 DNA photolyase [Roseibacterium sp. SDUM158016]